MKSDKKRLVENFFSLSVLQIINYILPLINLPYLVRVLGPEQFGLFTFSQAFMQYFVLITDFGFNLSATHEISINRANKTKISKIFTSVIIAKAFLCLSCFLVLLIMVFSFQKFSKDFVVYLVSFGIVIGNVIYPIWFFQGTEKMKYVTIFNTLAKIIFTLLVFMLVKTKADFILAPLFLSLGFIISGVISMVLAFNILGTGFSKVSFSDIKNQYNQSWDLFVSSISSNFYTTTNVFLLGIMSDNLSVAYYSAAEKVVSAVKRLFIPFTHSLFPYVSKKVSGSKALSIELTRKMLRMAVVPCLVLSICLFIFASNIVYLLFGPTLDKAVIVLRILSVIPFITALSLILGMLTMIPYGLKKDFSRILFYVGILNIFIVTFLISKFNYIGVACGLVFVETLIVILMAIKLRKHGIL